MRTVTHKPTNGEVFLLDRAKKRPASFATLRPRVVSTAAGVGESVARASKDCLWISYARDLTEALVRKVAWPVTSLGSGLLVHPLDTASLPALSSCFRRVAYATAGGFLPAGELAEALAAENRSDLFVGGNVDLATETLTLWRGDLTPLTVPFTAFETSGDGTAPDFARFSVIDCGQTVRLGEYEAATDALLYEFDPVYRRRVAKRRLREDRSFGASVRRLRKQRGLRREDFEPDVTAKTIARIEQGKVRRVHDKTLQVLADRLAVAPEEIATF